jgi:hypothetical protein
MNQVQANARADGFKRHARGPIDMTDFRKRLFPQRDEDQAFLKHDKDE